MTIETPHNHTFVFLRQEKKNIAYDRNPTWQIEDVFYCSACLQYQRVKVVVLHPRNDGSEYEERLV